MTVSARFNAIYDSSIKLRLTNKDKLILMSDIHRGDNSWSDNFAHNKKSYLAALNYYYKNNFTYVEIGDGDELWENNYFSTIINTHYEVFNIFKKFINKNRFFMLYGNHDIDKSKKDFLSFSFDDSNDNQKIIDIKNIFKNIIFHEGLILEYKENTIFLIHGHQGDLINEKLLTISRYLANGESRILENHLGFKDPTIPASNSKKRKKVELRIIDWIIDRKQFVITGHTHNPTLPKPGSLPYANTGSCVHPHCITGIEIKNGNISLVAWSTTVNKNNILYIDRKILAGPFLLDAYFSENCSYTFKEPIY